MITFLLDVLGAVTLALYVLIATGWAIYAYVNGYNPNRISPTPTRRRGKRHFFWPYRPAFSLIEGLIWPYSAFHIVGHEFR